jgi:23S rRNA (adenine2503-C2)-methyltransferase
VVTVGIVPYIHEMIKDFYDKGIHIRLNISLHASTNELRKKLRGMTGGDRGDGSC